MLRLSAVLCLTLYMACALCSPAAAQERMALIEELVIRSGIRHQIRQIPELMDQSLATQQNAQLSQEQIQALTSVMREAFEPERFEKEVIGHLGKSLKTPDIEKTLDWLDSPLGQRITDLENNAISPEAEMAIQKLMGQPLESQAFPEQLAQMKKIDKALHASELLTDFIVEIQITLLKGFTASLPDHGRAAIEQAKAALKQQRVQIRQMAERNFTVRSLYTYRPLSNVELSNYIDFINSPSGQRYHQASFSALRKAFLKACAEAGEKIGRLATASQGPGTL